MQKYMKRSQIFLEGIVQVDVDVVGEKTIVAAIFQLILYKFRWLYIIEG